jgi:hypothetical protein
MIYVNLAESGFFQKQLYMLKLLNLFDIYQFSLVALIAYLMPMTAWLY